MKKSDAEKLDAKHKKDWIRLRRRCKHVEKSDWVAEYWAPGHGTGRQVKYCLNCRKALRVK